MLSLLPFLAPLFGCAWHSAANFASLCNASVSPPTIEALAAGFPSYIKKMTAMSLFLKAEKQSLLVFLVLPINKEILVKFCHKENGVNSAANVEIGDSLQEIC